MVVGPRGRHRDTVVVICLVGAVMLAGCGGPSQPPTAPTPVRIGLLAPATGPTASAGLDALRGTQLAADVINQAYPDLPIPFAAGTGLPGLGGRTLALVNADTRGTADESANQAGQVIATGVVALVTADSAEAVAAAGSQAQRLRVPLVDAHSTSDYVTELGMDWYFRTGPGDRLLAETAFALLRQQLANTAVPSVAVLAEADAPGAATTELVRDLAERAGYPIAPQETVLGQGTPVEQAQRIDQSGADVVLALVSTPEAAAQVMAVTARLATPVPVIAIGHGFDDPPRPPGQPTVVLRAASWSVELARRNPIGKAVADLYAGRFGVAMTDVAASAFTATMTLASAINTAGSDDPAAIRAALRQTWQPATKMIMPWNGIRFDANGRNLLAAGVIEGREAAGFRVVFPRELATGPMVWTAAGADA